MMSGLGWMGMGQTETVPYLPPQCRPIQEAIDNAQAAIPAATAALAAANALPATNRAERRQKTRQVRAARGALNRLQRIVQRYPRRLSMCIQRDRRQRRRLINRLAKRCPKTHRFKVVSEYPLNLVCEPVTPGGQIIQIQVPDSEVPAEPEPPEAKPAPTGWNLIACTTSVPPQCTWQNTVTLQQVTTVGAQAPPDAAVSLPDVAVPTPQIPYIDPISPGATILPTAQPAPVPTIQPAGPLPFLSPPTTLLPVSEPGLPEEGPDLLAPPVGAAAPVPTEGEMVGERLSECDPAHWARLPMTYPDRWGEMNVTAVIC